MNSVDFEATNCRCLNTSLKLCLTGARSFWHSDNGSRIVGLYEMRMFKSRSKGAGKSLFCIIESFSDSETSLTTS